MDEAGFRQWMDAYKRAYAERDPDAAAKLFADDATYQWGPFGDLLHGPGEIGDKWASAVLDERETDYRFDYEVLAVTDDVGICRWIASADVPAEGKRVLYDGVFAVVLEGDLCSEFREWWNTSEVRLGS
jgi:ketosteroid isomerase-like protein